MIDQNDERTRRCPLLGHQIPFSYCRKPGADIPCRKIFDCWWEAFDVKRFMEEHYSEETIAEILKPAVPKVSAILALVKQAKERMGEK
jgi:hypothetical protein